LSLSTELEQLHKKKVDLIDELQSICEGEKALKEMVKILEEKLAVQELSLSPLPTKPLEWYSSPEMVRDLYSS
jgi:hypothetical protein